MAKEEIKESREHLRTHSSYIIGVVAIIISVFNPLPGIVLGIVGLSQSLRQKNEISNSAKKLNIIAIIIGIIFVALSIILSVLGITNITNITSA